MLNKQSVSGWQGFAIQNNLIFKPDNFFLMRKAQVTGNYCGYSFRLNTFYREAAPHLRFGLEKLLDPGQIYTRMALWMGHSTTITQSDKDKSILDRKLNLQRVLELLIPVEIQEVVKGRFFVFENGRQIIYEQKNSETDAEYLQVVLGLLKSLIEIYPRLVEVGGEIVPILQPISKRYHILQHVMGQLIFDIGQDTEKRLKKRASHLLCPQCLVHCGAHQVNVPWIGNITYYGCRACGQSRNLVIADKYRLVMCLDRDLTAEQIDHNETIRINWIQQRKLIDFEELEIVKATDEDVESFTVQVGNDTDPIRKPRYKQMRCLLSADCSLSENTMRILRRTFGEIEIKDVGYWQS